MLVNGKNTEKQPAYLQPMKTKNKIIFLRENELLEKDYIRFDIDFLSKFFHILVFNCFSYFNYKTGTKNNYSKKKNKESFCI